jgi:hypothetical protein
VYTGVILDRVAAGGAVIDSSKYSVSKNPLTGLYYRLHILTVGVSALKKYKCVAVIDGVVQYFYLKLDLLGRCNYILVILIVVKQVVYACR